MSFSISGNKNILDTKPAEASLNTSSTATDTAKTSSNVAINTLANLDIHTTQGSPQVNHSYQYFDSASKSKDLIQIKTFLELLKGLLDALKEEEAISTITQFKEDQNFLAKLTRNQSLVEEELRLFNIKAFIIRLLSNFNFQIIKKIEENIKLDPFPSCFSNIFNIIKFIREFSLSLKENLQEEQINLLVPEERAKIIQKNIFEKILSEFGKNDSALITGLYVAEFVKELPKLKLFQKRQDDDFFSISNNAHTDIKAQINRFISKTSFILTQNMDLRVVYHIMSVVEDEQLRQNAFEGIFDCLQENSRVNDTITLLNTENLDSPFHRLLKRKLEDYKSSKNSSLNKWLQIADCFVNSAIEHIPNDSEEKEQATKLMQAKDQQNQTNLEKEENLLQILYTALKPRQSNIQSSKSIWTLEDLAYIENCLNKKEETPVDPYLQAFLNHISGVFKKS